jgi:MSHA biogenesis protein MshO
MRFNSRMPIGIKTLQRGFTLVEAVIVIVITGIIAAMVSIFITAPVQSYFDSTRRAELSDVTDTALRRISRDLHLALPNSIRTPSNGSNLCFEFIPTSTGGRYRSQCSTQPCPAAEDDLNFAAGDAAFDVLGGLISTPAANDRVVIYNLGIAPADAYGGGNMATIISPLSTNKITLATATQFPFASPYNRFHVVPNADQAVFYACSGLGIDAAGNGTGALYRFSQYGFNAAQPAACPTPSLTMAILAKNLSTCSFTYAPGATQRNALVAMRLGMTQKNETVSLYHKVHVSNVP